MGVCTVDFVQFPSIIKDKEEIYSENLKNFFRDKEIEGNKIPLSALRAIYRKDKYAFADIVDELSLRGFSFHPEKPNNILPNKAADLSAYIVAEEDGRNFENINFNRLGIPNFVKRFHVDSDLFFHKIPLDGFTALNGNLHLDEVREEFEYAGFAVFEAEGLPDERKEDAEENGGIFSKLPISRVFHENKFNLFRNFCKGKNYEYVSEITDDVIDQFSRAPSVGRRKLLDLEERLQEIRSKSEEELAKLYLDEGKEEPVIDNNYFATVAIDKLFNENRFTKFREFCRHEGLVNVGDILQAHIDKFASMPGVGRKKVTDVEEALRSFSEKADTLVESSFQAGELYEELKDWKVKDLLAIYGIAEDASFTEKLGDISGKKYAEFGEDADVPALMALSERLQNQKRPAEIIASFETVLTEREYDVLFHRFRHGKTLEELAQMFGVTRQRIQQIERKAIAKAKEHLHASHFPAIVQMLSPGERFINGENFRSLLGDGAYAAEIVKDDIFPYHERFDVFFFDEDGQKLFNGIEQFIDDLPDEFYLYEYESEWKEVLEKVGLEDSSLAILESLLEKNGFMKYGDLVTRQKLYLHDLLSHMFKKHIDGPLRLDDEAVEKLKQIARDHYDYELEGSFRSIDARLRDAENVLLVDRGTFQYFDGESIDQTLMEKVDAYLQERLETANVVNAEEVFNAFEDELAEHGIYNKHHLYSLIRYFYDGDYNIGQGNTLNIFRKDGKKVNAEETVLDLLKKKGGVSTKKELLEELHWKPYKLDLVVSSSRELIPWGQNQITFMGHLDLTETEKDELIKLAKGTIKDGYTTAALIYKELMFHPVLAPLINKKGIDEYSKLAAVIKVLVPSLKGHTNFLYLEDSQFTTIEDVIIHKFDGITSREEMREFAVEHGYKPVMAFNIIGKLLEQGLFIEVDTDELCPARKFQIPEDVIQQLIDFVEEKMDGKQYLSLSDVKGYRKRLPRLDEFRWNAYLMRSILVRRGYRQIQKIYNDYRYDKIIIVKEDSPIETFEQLVHHILKEEYDGNMHEVPVYDFLAEKGIFREQEYDHMKVLPYEIKNSGKLIQVDELGFVTLK